MKPRKLLCMLLCILMLLQYAAVPVFAEEAAEPAEAETEKMTVTRTACPEIDLPDNDELFSYYVDQKLYDYEISTFGTKAREQLTATEQEIYDVLKAKIEDIAAKGGSTEFALDNVSGLKTTFTNKDLGVSRIDDPNLIEEAFLAQFNMDAIHLALLNDCPFDLYWYDKTLGYRMPYSMSWSSTTAWITDIKMYFTVSVDYQGSNTTTVTSDVARVSTAKTNAAKLVADCASLSDYEKIVAYKDYILSAVDYNNDAVDNDAPYGDPWQLINVFDGDSSTDVVCEGYSKALQYLCDLSGLDCICADGITNGPHMWNVVTLDGKNYLVDLTNCDEGTIGAPDLLFLVGGTYTAGVYHYPLHDLDFTYTCADLNLSETNYSPSVAPRTYTVSVDANIANGSVAAEPANAAPGTEITLTVTPNEGYVLDSLSAVYDDNQNLDITDGKFIMPAADVTVSAIFKEDTSIMVEMTDAYGDGWNGNLIYAVIWDGETETVLNDSITIEDGDYATVIMDVPANAIVRFYWIVGTWPNECSFNIYRNGNLVYTAADCGSMANGEMFFESKIVDPEAAAVRIGDVNYATLADAVACVQDDDHIVLLRDNDETNIVMNREVCFFINSNGFRYDPFGSVVAGPCLSRHVSGSPYEEYLAVHNFWYEHNAVYTPNYDGTHNVVCDCGMWTGDNKPCCFENGVCIECQAKLDYGNVVAWLDSDHDGEMDDDEQTFSSLQNAFLAVENAVYEDQTVIRMYDDVDLGDGCGYINSGVFTLDLNGKTIRSSSMGSGTIEIYGDTVTITDSDPNKGGMIIGEYAGVVAEQGTVVVASGTVCGNYSFGLLVHENANAFIIGDAIIRAPFAVGVSGGTVDIEGGTISAEVFALDVFNGAVVRITGGTIMSGTEYSVCDSTVEITGGSFNIDPSEYVAEGFAVMLNSENGLYEVYEGTAEGLKITAQPTDYVGIVGETATFTVEAEGESLKYQWYYYDSTAADWMKASTGASATLHVEFKSYRNNQQYRCEITDANGNTVTTNIVRIVAKVVDLVIITQPVDYVGSVNDELSYTVEATGNGLTYQWYYSDDEGVTWTVSGTPGFNTETLHPILRAYRDGYRYKCQITDVFGNKVTSDVVSATVKSSAVIISEQPVDVENGILNQLQTFKVTASGDNLEYRWEYSDDGGTTWQLSWNSGYDTDTLTVRLYAYRSGYLYRCKITSGLKTVVYSNAVDLVLQAPSVTIVKQPTKAAVIAGKTISFEIEATGRDLTYQWYRSNDNGNTWIKTYLGGYNTDNLSFSANAARAALYRCQVTDGSGTSAWSNIAKLQILSAELKILTQPASVTCANGATANFTVAAQGDALQYRWYCSSDGSSWTYTYLGGYNTPSLSFSVTAARAAKLYKCVITDAGGNTAESTPVSVTIS